MKYDGHEISSFNENYVFFKCDPNDKDITNYRQKMNKKIAKTIFDETIKDLEFYQRLEKYANEISDKMRPEVENIRSRLEKSREELNTIMENQRIKRNPNYFKERCNKEKDISYLSNKYDKISPKYFTYGEMENNAFRKSLELEKDLDYIRYIYNKLK